MIVYFGPPLRAMPDRKAVQQAMRAFGAYVAMWSYDYDASRGPWYSIVCDTPDYDVDSIHRKNVRYYVRRSLKSCAFRPVDMKWIAEHAYSTFAKASVRYSNGEIESQNSFEKRLLALSSDSRYRAYAAEVDGKLAAYSLVVDLGETLNVAVAKFDPEFSAAYPMYGLYYTIAHDALKDGRFRYVDNGTRPLLHDTNIGEFLFRMEWRKAYCKLGIAMHPAVKGMAVLLGRSRRLWEKHVPDSIGQQLHALLKAQEIARQSDTNQWPEEPSADPVTSDLS